MEDYYDDHFIAFVRICCSFGSDWNGGYARNVRKDRPDADLLNSIRDEKTISAETEAKLNEVIPAFVSANY
jgi:hypothetical protein